MKSKSFIFSLSLFLLAGMGVAMIAWRGEPRVIETKLENLPMEIAGFRGLEGRFPDSVYKELNADRHVYRHYRDRTGRQVHLYIGYYGTAKGGRTGHNPYACLPGAGWAIIEARNLRLKTRKFADGVDLNWVLARKGEVYETVIHWYQSAGVIVLATGFDQNIQRFLGRILHNRNDGAFVRVSVLTHEEGLPAAGDLARSFSVNILDLLPDYWPVEE